MQNTVMRVSSSVKLKGDEFRGNVGRRDRVSVYVPRWEGGRGYVVMR